MYMKPTLNPDEIFNQLVETNNDRQRELRLEAEVERLSHEMRTIILN